MKHSSAKPVLKWAGGKGQLLSQLSEKLPKQLKNGKIEKYIEPFVGGGAVFFEIIGKYPIKEAFLFDINPELVILYNVIKNDVKLLIKELAKLQSEYFASDDQKAYFYNSRDEYNRFNKNIDANKYSRKFVRRAALTVFLNRTCFNGLYRVNSKNLFNVPIGRYKNPRILDEENLLNVSEVFRNATILQADFSKALEYADKKAFVYYDPPYRPIAETSSFNSYTTSDFNDDEQKRLKSVFAKVDKRGALQMLSNSDPTNYVKDTFFDELYKGYKIYRVSAKRLINSDATKRNEIRELLITNY